MQTYTFSGSVHYFGDWIGKWTLDTVAESKHKAESNIRWQIAQRGNYNIRGIQINNDAVKLKEAPQDKKSPMIKQETKPTRCDICHAKLNDDGTCPYCDGGQIKFGEELNSATHLGGYYNYEPIHKYLQDNFGFGDEPSPSGAQLIDKEGKYLKFNSLHGDLLIKMIDDKIVQIGSGYLDEYNYVNTDLFGLIGFVRCNNSLYDYNYIQLPQKITPSQMETIESWVIKFFEGGGYTVLDTDGIDTHCNYMYEIDDQHMTKDYMMMLRRYNNTGKLEDVHKYHEGVHFGDLDKAIKADQRDIMSGRDTGHFGTGFYFVNDRKKDIPKSYNDRGHWNIDQDKYKLFTPQDNKQGYDLHDALKVINSSPTDIMAWKETKNVDHRDEVNSIISPHEITTDDIMDYYFIDEDEAYDKWLNDDYDYEEILDYLGYTKDGTKERLRKYLIDNHINENSIDRIVQEYEENDWRYFYYDVDEAFSRRDRQLQKWNWAKEILSKIFGKDVTKEMEAAVKSNSQEDSKSTVFMKSLGYEGIDVTHLDHDGQGYCGLDNFSYGSVIYDLKPGTYRKVESIVNDRDADNVQFTDEAQRILSTPIHRLGDKYRFIAPGFERYTLTDVLNLYDSQGADINWSVKDGYVQGCIVAIPLNGGMDDFSIISFTEKSNLQLLIDAKNLVNKYLDEYDYVGFQGNERAESNKLYKMFVKDYDVQTINNFGMRGITRYEIRKKKNESITESGYSGWSMSNNAVDAYDNGEKPLTKWTKDDILTGVKEVNKDIVPFLQKVSVGVLRKYLLKQSSWHHTSLYYNRTNFYSIDDSAVEELTPEEIQTWQAHQSDVKPNKSYRGNIDYIEWGGTRNYPKAIPHTLNNVNIEERGSFYIVTDDNGKEILRKKIGSNGTYVTKGEQK